MSSVIQDTCTLIATNQKKIYDLGFNNGKAEAVAIEPILFTIDGVCYVAPKGMSWGSYINSNWNVGFSIGSNNRVVSPGETELFLSYNNEEVKSRDAIGSSYNYAISGYLELGTYLMKNTVTVDESMTQELQFASSDGTKLYRAIQTTPATASGTPYVYYLSYSGTDVAYDGTRLINMFKINTKKQIVPKKFYNWIHSNYTYSVYIVS